MAEQSDYEYFCTEMPTLPRPECGIILITGATGYIGGRLVPGLRNRGYKTRVLVRDGMKICRNNSRILKLWSVMY
ncbi:MAG: NmrA family NAD(P)-binding protein [Bacteroidales bacterium]|nr:NmrA family NAD(P)-binding protein [Bacteroidales bacterium]